MQNLRKKEYVKPEIAELSASAGTMDLTKNNLTNEGQPTGMAMQKGMSAS